MYERYNIIADSYRQCKIRIVTFVPCNKLNTMNTSKKTALVAGANGIIGNNLVEHLLSLKAWEVIGLSRKGGQNKPGLQHIATDLLDKESCKKELSGLNNVTHIFYSAYQDRPTW